VRVSVYMVTSHGGGKVVVLQAHVVPDSSVIAIDFLDVVQSHDLVGHQGQVVTPRSGCLPISLNHIHLLFPHI
jgi:hypothetical protein